MRSPSIRRHRSRRGSRGVAAVEFGLVLILLVPMMVGMTEYGRAVYQYDTLTKSVRTAARYLGQRASTDTTAPTAATCLAVYANTGCTGTALLSGLTTQQVAISSTTVTDATAGKIEVVEVTISNFRFNSLLPGLVSNMTFGPIKASFERVQ